MRRGTTPTLCFRLPFEARWIDHGIITFKQNRRFLFERDYSDCVVVDDRFLHLKLTQEETLKMNAYYNLDIQFRVVFQAGTVGASQIVHIDIKDIIDKKGVIY